MTSLITSPNPSLILGHTGPLRALQRFGLSPAEVKSHKHIIGLTGVGKSKFICTICGQFLKAATPFAVVDPHTDLGLDLIQLLLDTGYFADNRAYQRLLYVDFSHPTRAVPFNVLKQTQFDAHTIARQIVEVCKRVWPSLADGAGPLFEVVMLNSVVVLVENGLPLTDLLRLLTDKAARDAWLTRVTDPQIVHFFHQRFDRWGREQPLLIESTARRAQLLTFSKPLRYSLGAHDNILNFRKLIDDRISVIYNLGGLDEETQRFLGALITVGYEVASLSRSDVPEEARGQYHLVLDEFSMYSAQTSESLARVLSLCRKYGLFMTLAHQTWSQLSERLQGAMQNCVEIAFKLGRSDAEWAARQFSVVNLGRIKHQVSDPDQLDRTHPLYLSIAEQHEEMAQALEQLKPREALVRVGNRRARIKTLTVPPRKASRAELQAVIDRYAETLLVPRDAVAETVDAPPPPPVPRRRLSRVESIE